MMLSRRILQKKPWSSGRRWLSYSYASQTSPPLTVASEQRTLFWRFSSRACISQYPSTSMYSANKLNYLKISYGMKGCGYSSHALADLPIDGIVDVPLAQTGEGIAECELLKWFVQEGDQVEEFQPLCEVQSDKATIEITSRYKGQVSQILHVPGDIVKVGETLLKMVVSESSVPVGSDVCDPDDQGSLLKTTDTGGVLSTPAVRDLAKQYGIDINAVSGTGEDGRILREDVVKYALQTGKFEEIPSLNAISAEQTSGREKKFPDVSAAYGRDFEDKKITLRAFQRAMVKSMTLASNVPHFHYVEDINCNEIMDLKSFFQNENSDPDIKHTSLPILIKSLSMALNQYPLLNSTFNEELHEITLKGSHNVGLAMATPHGLVVPNIKRVQSLSILEITKELARLHKLALANKLRPEDISGGTITLSNIGAIGGKFGSPLINVPEVCIIAIGRIKKFPRYGDDGNVHPMSVMTVNVGADHRVLDGATVARFCNEWKQYVEKPELIMLHTR